MSKKILFLSKDNLTSNPRLQKELKLTVEAGFEVDFIGFYSGNWSDKIDEEIIKQINANFHYISANRNSFFKWFLSSLIEKISQKIVFLFKNNFKINAFASNKRSFLLNNYLKSKMYNFNNFVTFAFQTDSNNKKFYLL